jgi:DNA-binding NarL/FixJ family response regulator
MGELAQNEPDGSNSWPAIDRRRPIVKETAPSHAGIHAAENQDIVTDHPQLCATVLVGRSDLSLEGLARILDKTDFQVVASAASVDHLAPSDVQQHEAVLLILDAGHDVEAAIRQVQLLKQLHAAPRIAVILGEMRPTDIASLFQAGVNACFAEGATRAIFLKSLELVMLGETLVPATMLSIRRHQEAPNPEPAPGGSGRLSPQEECILSNLVEGHPNKVIARKLEIADATVKVHVKNILRKIRVNNRTQAALWAMSHGSLRSSTDSSPLAPALSAGDSAPPLGTSPIRDGNTPKLPPAGIGSLGDEIPEAPIALFKLDETKATPESAFEAQSRISPSEQRIAEEQVRRDEFTAKMRRLRDLREARNAVRRGDV